MLRVGGSMCPGGRCWSTAGEATVSATPAPSEPAIITMSPAAACLSSMSDVPTRLRIFVIRVSTPASPVCFSTRTLSPTARTPLWTRPVARRPTKGSRATMATSIENGSSRFTGGGGTCSRIVSIRGFKDAGEGGWPGGGRVRETHPCRAEAYRTWKSSWASEAPRDAKRSKMSLSTVEQRSGVELSRSTLLRTTMGDRPALRAFSRTNFV
mmetsp:Transcript_21826/g.60635  ORF Transcript_21826/g.60635 Transcript_21826/m.60635 type:complete len:211 (+) Transcript_21826:823-1455(+)